MAAYKTFPQLENRDLAFPNMATETLPLALGILVLLAGLSATLSSASSDAIAGVTTVIRDLYKLVLGRVPKPGRVVTLSRYSLGITTALALGMALAADNVIDYIKLMISLFLTGMCVVGVLGRTWPRYNAAGAIASLVGASVTALAFKFMPDWNDYWGNPVIPSLAVSIAIGVGFSLFTPPDPVSHKEAIEILAKEREAMEE